MLWLVFATYTYYNITKKGGASKCSRKCQNMNMEVVMTKGAENRIIKTFLLGILAGFAIGLGGLGYLCCLALGHKILGSFVFSFGLLLENNDIYILLSFVLIIVISQLCSDHFCCNFYNHNKIIVAQYSHLNN